MVITTSVGHTTVQRQVTSVGVASETAQEAAISSPVFVSSGNEDEDEEIKQTLRPPRVNKMRRACVD